MPQFLLAIPALILSLLVSARVFVRDPKGGRRPVAPGADNSSLLWANGLLILTAISRLTPWPRLGTVLSIVSGFALIVHVFIANHPEKFSTRT